MDSIDVRELPEAQAQLVAEFVAFLRQKIGTARAVPEEEADEQGWGEAAAMSFAKDWDNGRDAVYDNWQVAHLLRPSWVRSKLATLDPVLVRYSTGQLSAADLAEVGKRIHLTLGLR